MRVLQMPTYILLPFHLAKIHCDTSKLPINYALIAKKWSRTDWSIGNTSGVARVICALEYEIFLRPQSTKTTEFEVKNRRKSAEKAKVGHLLL